MTLNPEAKCNEFIRRFLRNLYAAGGVITRKTYMDLLNETLKKSNFDRIPIKDCKLPFLRSYMESLGYLMKTGDLDEGIWVLTMEGLRFAKEQKIKKKLFKNGSRAF